MAVKATRRRVALPKLRETGIRGFWLRSERFRSAGHRRTTFVRRLISARPSASRRLLRSRRRSDRGQTFLDQIALNLPVFER